MLKLKFKNIDEIQKYYQKQVNNGNKTALNDIKAKNGKTYSQLTDEILIEEAKRLYECIQARINEYYSSYSPKFYTRSEDLGRRGLRDALMVETSVQNDKNGKYIGLYFEDSISWGRSVVDGNWTGYKPWLMDTGFKNKSYRTPHFLGYEGFHFIDKGIEDWERALKNSVEVIRIGPQGKFDIASQFGYSFD